MSQSQAKPMMSQSQANPAKAKAANSRLLSRVIPSLLMMVGLITYRT
jgi:hypothetical protein